MPQVEKSEIKIATVHAMADEIAKKKTAAERSSLIAGGGAMALDRAISTLVNAQKRTRKEAEDGAFDEVAALKDPVAIAGLINTKITRLVEAIRSHQGTLENEKVAQNAKAQALSDVEAHAKKTIETERAKLQKLLRDTEEAALRLEKAQKEAEGEQPKGKAQKRRTKPKKRTRKNAVDS